MVGTGSDFSVLVEGVGFTGLWGWQVQNLEGNPAGWKVRGVCHCLKAEFLSGSLSLGSEGLQLIERGLPTVTKDNLLHLK